VRSPRRWIAHLASPAHRALKARAVRAEREAARLARALHDADRLTESLLWQAREATRQHTEELDELRDHARRAWLDGQRSSQWTPAASPPRDRELSALRHQLARAHQTCAELDQRLAVAEGRDKPATRGWYLEPASHG
jgi:flagellar motility protein MotE (MotC chaperone)